MTEPPEKMAKLEKENIFESLSNLDAFELVEVLGSSVNRKSIFLLVRNTIEQKFGILLLNKIAYPENPHELQQLLIGSNLRRISDNDIYGNFELHAPAKFGFMKTTFIYPATEKHILKYRLEQPHYILETGDDYQKITLPYINESKFSCDWVYNILDGIKEQDQVLMKDMDPINGFMLLRDLKWDGKTMEEMYYQAIVVRRDLKSVRDLTDKEIPLLENILQKSWNAIEDKHGYPRSQLIFYFHYQPSYYHLHVHIRTTKCDSSITHISLREAIENLKVWPDYYQKAPLGFYIKEGEKLYKEFEGASRLYC